MEALRETGGGCAPKDFSVRIGQDEMGRILGLKENLDFNGVLGKHAAGYQRLGWKLLALSATDRTPVDLDFNQPEVVWSKRLNDLGLEGIQINLGVQTGFDSRLLVLEVTQESAAILDGLGQWRADCVARGQRGREQHYYALPVSQRLPASGNLNGFEILVFGEGEMVLAPPSRESRDADPWRWLAPPWESPPRPPAPGVCGFLAEHAIHSRALGEAPEILSWKEIYHLISPYEGVLRALLAPVASQGEYYQAVIDAALAAGLESHEVLMGLLWHSPQGDAKDRPEGWAYLQQMVSRSRQVRGNGLNRRSFMEELETGAHLDQVEVVSLVSLPGDNRPQVFLEPLPPNGPGAGPSSRPELKEPEDAALRKTYPIDDDNCQVFPEDPPPPGEKVLLERTRYEGLLYELGKLSNTVDELKRREADRKTPGGDEPESGKTSKRPWEASERLLADLPGKGAKAMNYQDDLDRSNEEQAQFMDFLKRNPDLAADPRKIQIVEYCLNNYININRELAALPIEVKLEKAGQMARNFLEGTDKKGL